MLLITGVDGFRTQDVCGGSRRGFVGAVIAECASDAKKGSKDLPGNDIVHYNTGWLQ